ncbi:Multisite-specific tRNA:(cytosine-C(5))-methyltransferase [Neolecta irregularis DAH-3]|uniref:Multisite-specific tRNA:(Cytosine-C(5))-methyltransferase n=1 Tax=Neolecta irregularis (strain DAH-3) TaxID=1198029 RepID=A0A1U7LUE9_NEOID|nr:Multisite-specific tRNA:(cytosine-C(5))-methyltransferase [Neolecta irregularis DAH-3]|eukprot:OLL26300.1 Multisite-specific tRNA:(cytosine-C(5))-methyltransferase [Neolecta irregularis DAH-3]
MPKKRRNQKRNGQAERKPSTFQDIVKENVNFEKYYKSQGFIPDYQEFMASLRQTLPTTFRITGSKAQAIDIRNALKRDFFPSLKGIVWEDQVVKEPEELKWYPESLAWSLNVGKAVIRRSPPFKKFQTFLVYETEAGSISRQEAVSMIPPLLLQVKSNHVVLDMCAAPGSKTAQLIEALHANGSTPTGVVVANDSDYKRSHLLIHQVKRLCSPCLMVTNHDATQFPNVVVNDEILKFDRILADVPCSGDGTFRKNIALWNTWGVGHGLGLHSLQLRILLRGLQMLKVGGRLVYSTCSINPMENEAVLAGAIRHCGTAVRIVDVGSELPGLKTCPGLTTWKVMAHNGEWITEPNERCTASMFPPSDEEIKEFNLERCLRIYPHLQDTGGFFICVIEKVAKLDPDKRKAEGSSEQVPKKQKLIERPDTPLEQIIPSPSEMPESPRKPLPKHLDTPTSQIVDEVTQPPMSPKKHHHSHIKISSYVASDVSELRLNTPIDQIKMTLATPPTKPQKRTEEDPYMYLSHDHLVIRQIKNFYELDPSFNLTNFLVRNTMGEPTRGMYYTTPIIKSIIIANVPNKLHLVHAGIRMFAKQDTDATCNWRIQDDALGSIYDFIKGRKVSCGGIDLDVLLKKAYPKLEDLSEEFRNQLEKYSIGGCVLEVDTSDVPEYNITVKMIFPLWKGHASVNMMVAKQDKMALLMRMNGGEIPEIDVSVGQRDKSADGVASSSIMVTEYQDTILS